MFPITNNNVNNNVNNNRSPNRANNLDDTPRLFQYSFSNLNNLYYIYFKRDTLFIRDSIVYDNNNDEVKVNFAKSEKLLKSTWCSFYDDFKRTVSNPELGNDNDVMKDVKTLFEGIIQAITTEARFLNIRSHAKKTLLPVAMLALLEKSDISCDSIIKEHKELFDYLAEFININPEYYELNKSLVAKIYHTEADDDLLADKTPQLDRVIKKLLELNASDKRHGKLKKIIDPSSSEKGIFKRFFQPSKAKTETKSETKSEIEAEIEAEIETDIELMELSGGTTPSTNK